MEADRLFRTVARAARGDREAAGALFDHYHPRVYRYALARLGRSSDAEDVAAETFARVLNGLGRFRWKGAGFEAWLFRIASNLVKDQLRGRVQEPAGESDTLVLPAPEEASPEAHAERSQLRRDLGVLIGGLSEDQREVVLLRFAAGLDTNEVARVMGRKVNAVRQLQFRALSALRKGMPGG